MISCPNSLMNFSLPEFFPPSRTTNLRNEISNFQQKFDESFHEAWDRYKDLLCACPHHGFTELHQLDPFYNALNPTDQDSLDYAAGGNLLERSTQDVLTIIKNKSKVCNSQNKSIVSQMKSNDGNSSSSSDIAKLTHAVNQQTSACLAADSNTFPEYRDNIQGYVAAAAGNYNQGNAGYRPPGVANQTRPPGFVQQNGQNNQNHFGQPQGYNRGNNFNQNANYQAQIQQNQSVPLNELEKFKKTNDVNMKAMQAQINNVKNELRNEMQSSIQASMSNQTNKLKNMMASFFKMNTASTSGTGSLPSNTVANPKGELKAITTRSGLILDGPTVPMPHLFINQEEDERAEETLTDPKHGEYTIKVPPPQVQKAKPPSQRNFLIHQRDPHYPHTPYPSRMNQEKQKEKDKKLPKKLGDPGKFLIPCGFNELKCKALADLGASINLMPLSVWKELGLPELISTQMTLELANCDICTPKGIARDVFVPVGKFTFPADFFIVDYESDPCVLLILGANVFVEAIEARFGGNEATKKTQKTLLKQMYETFSASSSESLDFILHRLQKIVSQLTILGEIITPEELNLKFLRSLPTEWGMHVVVWRNKSDLGSISFDDIYNNFKIVEPEVKRSVTSSSNSGSQNLAFVSGHNSTNDGNTDNVSLRSWAFTKYGKQERFYQWNLVKKIIINGSDTAGYDKKKKGIKISSREDSECGEGFSQVTKSASEYGTLRSKETSDALLMKIGLLIVMKMTTFAGSSEIHLFGFGLRGEDLMTEGWSFLWQNMQLDKESSIRFGMGEDCRKIDSLEEYDKLHVMLGVKHLVLNSSIAQNYNSKDSEVCKFTRADGTSSFHGDFQALEMDSILEDSVDENSIDDNLDDTISEMFTDEHALNYSSPPL
ncbi:reverse transcriptase domain-containing protein [Tanacetum coccineum]